MAKLDQIKGLDEESLQKLQEAGIDSSEALLDKAGSPDGRKALVAETGVDVKALLGWLNRADLFRVNGVGRQFADLLEVAGVDTVPELAQRKAENLHKKMQKVNEEQKVITKLPRLDQVEDWVAQAKELPRKINY